MIRLGRIKNIDFEFSVRNYAKNCLIKKNKHIAQIIEVNPKVLS